MNTILASKPTFPNSYDLLESIEAMKSKIRDEKKILSKKNQSPASLAEKSGYYC